MVDEGRPVSEGAPPYRVLAVYVPPGPRTEWRAWKIGRDLTRITAAHGLRPLHDPAHGPQTTSSWHSVPLHAEVRRRASAMNQGAEWHQDGDMTPGSRMDHVLVLWADVAPVQLRDRRGRVFQPEPFQLVMFRNLDVHHRRPPNAPTERWSFRQRVEPPGA